MLMLMLNATKAELRAALPAAAATPLETADGTPAGADAPASAAAHCPRCESRRETNVTRRGDAKAAREDGTTVFARGHTMGVGSYVTYADCDGTAHATVIRWKVRSGSSRGPRHENFVRRNEDHGKMEYSRVDL